MIQRFKTQAIAYVCVGRPVYFLLAVKFFCKSDRKNVEGGEGVERVEGVEWVEWFEVAEWVEVSEGVDGWVAENCETITNSASSEARVEALAELGNT